MHPSILTLTTFLTLASAAPITTEDSDSITTVNTSPIQPRDMTGRGTYYRQLGHFGSCGKNFPDSAMIVALGTSWRDEGGRNCGRNVWAEALDGPGRGSRIQATVEDTCTECDPSSIDFSVGAFKMLTNNQVGFGVIQVRWDFV